MFGKLFSPRSKKDHEEPWPIFPTAGLAEPNFLFLLTPPCSGSTLLAKVLNSASRSMLLHPKGEGLWLVPGTRADNRWDPDFEINWESVRSVWLCRIELVRSLVGSVDLVIEKSPILLGRAEQIRAVFSKCNFVILNRDPLASCSSFFHRYNDPQTMDREQRSCEFRVLAEKWVKRSRVLRDQAEQFGIPTVRYEEFCADPAMQVRNLAKLIPELSTVDTGLPVKVKDYPSQGISNQNARQLKWLTDADTDAIQSVLGSNVDLLEYFGYSL